jgi:glycosyltransferase involved in cell wall biosynthesis
MDYPLISAVCCTHNRRAFVRKAIELFLAQTWPNKELVIMNDGEPENVPSTQGLPIRHVHTSGYEGMTRKARWAYEIASGEILCTWDDDDYFGPKRLETQAIPILDGRADGTGFGVDVIASSPDAKFWRWKPATLDEWKESTEKAKPVGSRVPFHDGSTMFRRSLLNGIPPQVREGWQLGLLDAMIEKGARLMGLPNDGHFVYVRHGGNAWRFATEERCIEVRRPEWMPSEMVDFWKRAEPSAEACAALASRDKDHNGI